MLGGNSASSAPVTSPMPIGGHILDSGRFSDARCGPAADEFVSARRLNMGGRSFAGAKQFDVGTRARLQTTYIPGGAL